MDEEKFNRLKEIADEILREEEENLLKSRQRVNVAMMNLKSVGVLQKIIGAKAEKAALEQAEKEVLHLEGCLKKVRESRKLIDARLRVYQQLLDFKDG